LFLCLWLNIFICFSPLFPNKPAESVFQHCGSWESPAKLEKILAEVHLPCIFLCHDASRKAGSFFHVEASVRWTDWRVLAKQYRCRVTFLIQHFFWIQAIFLPLDCMLHAECAMQHQRYNQCLGHCYSPFCC
jgi:hypothetical protein